MNEIKNMQWANLKDEEKDEVVTFIHTSLEKDATFRGMVKNVKAALNNSPLGIRTYIPTLEANVLCEGQDLLNAMGEMAKEMPLANDVTNQRTNVRLGLPRGCGGAGESNEWMLVLKSRARARSIAKAFSEHDVVAIGLEVGDHAISVHVAYKDEVENVDGLDSLPLTSKFLTRLMGYAA